MRPARAPRKPSLWPFRQHFSTISRTPARSRSRPATCRDWNRAPTPLEKCQRRGRKQSALAEASHARYVRAAVERDVIEASLSKSPSACSPPGPGRFPNDAGKRVGRGEGLPPLSYSASNVGCALRRSSRFSSGGLFVSGRFLDIRQIEADSPCRVAGKNMIKNSRMRLAR